MTSSSFLARVSFSFGVLAIATACTTTVVKRNEEPGAPDPSAGTGTGEEEPSLGNTPPLREKNDARVIAALKAGGIDLKNLPTDLDELVAEPDHERLKAVMESFKIALGTTCDGCHVKGAMTSEDFKTATPKKAIAKRMWTDFVVALKKADVDGAPATSVLYCDSCHQGKMKFLDRTDTNALGRWMQTNFVAALSRKNAAAHDCTTCHKDQPTPGPFLESWKTSPTD
jgi:hypothetical protein